MSRTFPWQLQDVPWSDWPQFTRGSWDGLPLLSWGTAPRDTLATRRQLRTRGLRPGGQDPVALLYFQHRPACAFTLAELFLIDRARPVRAMTPAKRAALDKALTARRTCRACGQQSPGELPRPGRICEPCRYRRGHLDPADPLHDYLPETGLEVPA